MTDKVPADTSMQAPARPRSLVLTFLRHQIGGAMAAVVDFAVMIAVVELLGISPVAGTALGAALGATASFLLGRTWVFGAQQGRVPGQALRYALVSPASLGFNTLGEHLALKIFGPHYVAARVLVATFVGMTWNFPLHHRFVFRRPR